MHGMRCAGHLTRDERIDTGISAFLWGFKGLIGLFSACIALVIPEGAPGWTITLAGLAYFLRFFIAPLNRRCRRYLEEHLQT